MHDESTEIDDAFGNWLAGFVDGEGCFVIQRKAGKHGYAYSPRFALYLRDDDRAILEEIQARTGVGKTWSKESRMNDRSQVGWVVSDRAGCARLAELFHRYPLRAKKARDFAIWREAVRDWVRLDPQANQFRRSRSGPMRDWTHIAALRTQLMDGRQYAALPCDQSAPSGAAALPLFEEVA